MTIRQMLTNNRLRRFRKFKPAAPSAAVLGAQEVPGGVTVRLSPKAVEMIAEMARRTGRDAEEILIDSLNFYQAIVESGELDPAHSPNKA